MVSAAPLPCSRCRVMEWIHGQIIGLEVPRYPVNDAAGAGGRHLPTLVDHGGTLTERHSTSYDFLLVSIYTRRCWSTNNFIIHIPLSSTTLRDRLIPTKALFVSRFPFYRSVLSQVWHPYSGVLNHQQ